MRKFAYTRHSLTLVVLFWIFGRGALAEDAAQCQQLLAEAQTALAGNDFSTAASRYRQVLKSCDDSAETWSNLGLMQYQGGEHSQAEASFQAALRRKPALFVPNLFLGLAYLESKRTREAVPYLLRAQKLNSRDPQPALALGRAYSELAQLGDACQWYGRAVELDSTSAEAWFGLGTSYLRRAQEDGAVLAKAHRESPYFHALTAEIEARQQLKKEESGTEENNGVPTSARHSCGHVSDFGLSARPESELLNQAACSFASGDYTAASLASHRLTRVSPRNAAGWYWAFKADRKLALGALSRAGEVDPGSPRNDVILGDAYRREKLYRNAEEEYEKALAVAPGDPAALFGLAANYFEDSRLDQALPAGRRAVARRPSDPEVNLLISEILVAKLNYEEAEPYLKRSLALPPGELPRVHALLGKVYDRTNRDREAVAELKLGLASDEDGSVHYQLARLYQKMGDQKSAAITLQEVKLLLKKREAREGQTMDADR